MHRDRHRSVYLSPHRTPVVLLGLYIHLRNNHSGKIGTSQHRDSSTMMVDTMQKQKTTENNNADKKETKDSYSSNEVLFCFLHQKKSSVSSEVLWPCFPRLHLLDNKVMMMWRKKKMTLKTRSCGGGGCGLPLLSLLLLLLRQNFFFFFLFRLRPLSLRGCASRRETSERLDLPAEGRDTTASSSSRALWL